MKESLVKLNTAAKALASMLDLWSAWTRLYVPNKTSWVILTLSGDQSANVHFCLSKEEVDILAPVVSQILQARVAKAECEMANAAFDRSFPSEGVDPEDDGFW